MSFLAKSKYGEYQSASTDLRNAVSASLCRLPVVPRSLQKQHGQRDDDGDNGVEGDAADGGNNVFVLRRIRPASKLTPGTAYC